jgi:hypothetical protein
VCNSFNAASSAAPKIPEDAGIEPRTLVLVVKRSNHSVTYIVD